MVAVVLARAGGHMSYGTAGGCARSELGKVREECAIVT